MLARNGRLRVHLGDEQSERASGNGPADSRTTNPLVLYLRCEYSHRSLPWPFVHKIGRVSEPCLTVRRRTDWFIKVVVVTGGLVSPTIVDQLHNGLDAYLFVCIMDTQPTGTTPDIACSSPTPSIHPFDRARVCATMLTCAYSGHDDDDDD